jgi:Mg2+ and Co2+ transporter CorA
VPTFITSLFGSNTAIPGQGEWSGFALMLVLIVVGAGGTYWAISPRGRRRQG